MYCVKAGKAIYWVFLVYNECFSGISPSYVHLDFEKRLSGSEMRAEEDEHVEENAIGVNELSETQSGP